MQYSRRWQNTIREGGDVVNRADEQSPHHCLGMKGVPAKVGAVLPFQGSHQLGKVQLLIDLHQKMVGINEVPLAFAGELEEGGVPAAAVQRLEHPHSSQMMDCSPISAQELCELAIMLAFSTSPSRRH